MVHCTPHMTDNVRELRGVNLQDFQESYQPPILAKGLTRAHHCCTLISRGSQWPITLNLPPRMQRATSANSRILYGDSLLFRTLKSRRNSTPKSWRRRGSGRPLPALPTQRVRTPFLPPCQSPPHRSDASQQSARVPA